MMILVPGLVPNLIFNLIEPPSRLFRAEWVDNIRLPTHSEYIFEKYFVNSDMRTKDKRNKQKLKFDYIEHLQSLGKIWKEHCNLVDSKISKSSKNYNNEVVKLMSKSQKKNFCLILDKCDDIVLNVRRIDGSLRNSHQNFSIYKELISQQNN